ncbi:MAG: UMP kinase [Oscillospiraceae bacterium]|nr:UMP kinase [Oscillospiraceae bacterium]
MKPEYKRVLIKVSGEALAGEKKTGLDFDFIGRVSRTIKQCVDMGVQVGVVVGGGNFWRGVKDGGGHMERSRADHMGMLATVMNCLALAEGINQAGGSAAVLTAVDMPKIAEPYTYAGAVEHLEKGDVVIFGCGTGSPYFSTDTGAVLKAVEIHADMLLLAKNVDAIYSDDPAKNPEAVRYDEITYQEILTKRLAVMDLTATSLAAENGLPLMLFEVKQPENILKALTGEKVGTVVKES